MVVVEKGNQKIKKLENQNLLIDDGKKIDDKKIEKEKDVSTQTQVDFDTIKAPPLETGKNAKYNNLFAEGAYDWAENYIGELSDILCKEHGSDIKDVAKLRAKVRDLGQKVKLEMALKEPNQNKITTIKTSMQKLASLAGKLRDLNVIKKNLIKKLDGQYRKNSTKPFEVGKDRIQGARKELSSSTSKKAQKAVIKAVNDSLEKAIRVAVRGKPLVPGKMDNLVNGYHYGTCKGMAKSKEMKLRDGKDFIQINQGYTVKIPPGQYVGNKEKTIEVKESMTQIGKFNGSLTSRDANVKGGGYNFFHCHMQIKVGNGDVQKIKFTRSGANDNFKVKPEEKQEYLKHCLETNEFKLATTALIELAETDIKKFDDEIDKIRTRSGGMTMKEATIKLAAAVAVLQAGKAPKSRWLKKQLIKLPKGESVSKLEVELEGFIEDTLIGERNVKMIKESYSEQLGGGKFDLSNDPLNQGELLKGIINNKNLTEEDREELEKRMKNDSNTISMVSLQTPASVSEKGLGKLATLMNTNKKLGKLTYANKLVQKENSELGTVFRENRALKTATKSMKYKSRYLNVPTNTFGMLTLPFDKKFSDVITSGKVDKAELREIRQANQDTINSVVEDVNEKIEDNEGTIYILKQNLLSKEVKGSKEFKEIVKVIVMLERDNTEMKALLKQSVKKGKGKNSNSRWAFLRGK